MKPRTPSTAILSARRFHLRLNARSPDTKRVHVGNDVDSLVLVLAATPIPRSSPCHAGVQRLVLGSRRDSSCQGTSRSLSTLIPSASSSVVAAWAAPSSSSSAFAWTTKPAGLVGLPLAIKPAGLAIERLWVFEVPEGSTSFVRERPCTFVLDEPPRPSLHRLWRTE